VTEEGEGVVLLARDGGRKNRVEEVARTAGDGSFDEAQVNLARVEKFQRVKSPERKRGKERKKGKKH
jgi:hypothetical protein